MLCNNMLTQGVIITFLDFTIILLLKPLGSQPQKCLVWPAFHPKIVLLECILGGEAAWPSGQRVRRAIWQSRGLRAALATCWICS